MQGFESFFSAAISYYISLLQHHCRNCGMVTCQECSSTRDCIYRYNFRSPVRVCDNCVEEVADSNTEWTRPIDGTGSQPNSASRFQSSLGEAPTSPGFTLRKEGKPLSSLMSGQDDFLELDQDSPFPGIRVREESDSMFETYVETNSTTEETEEGEGV